MFLLLHQRKNKTILAFFLYFEFTRNLKDTSYIEMAPRYILVKPGFILAVKLMLKMLEGQPN